MHTTTTKIEDNSRPSDKARDEQILRGLSMSETFTAGYGLDTAGYEFAPAPASFGANSIMCDGDFTDYIIGHIGGPYDEQGDMIVISTHFADLPDSGNVGDCHFTVVHRGVLHDSERECYCNGEMVAGEWEYSDDGSVSPDCARCDGSGFIQSPGGIWATYSGVAVEDICGVCRDDLLSGEHGAELENFLSGGQVDYTGETSENNTTCACCGSVEFGRRHQIVAI